MNIKFILKFPIYSISYFIYSFNYIYLHFHINKYNNEYIQKYISFFIRKNKCIDIKSATKTKSLVNTSNKKLWKQKGLGKARVRTKASPLWKGGGIIFGVLPKINNIKLNNKEIYIARNLILFNKRNNIIICNYINNFNNIYKLFGISNIEHILFITYKIHTTILRNIYNIKIIELLNTQYICFLI